MIQTMHLLIDKENISELITDIQNIDDKKINREILDVQKFDLLKQIPVELFNAFVALKVANYRSWSRTKTYSIGDYAINDGRLWLAIIENTNSLPAPDNVNWSEKEIYFLFNEYIVPFLAFCSYSKYAVEHGLNASPHGFTKVSEGNITAIDKNERAMIVNKYQNRGDKYFMDFMNWMSENDYTIDTIKYTFTCDNSKRISPRIKFKGV